MSAARVQSLLDTIANLRNVIADRTRERDEYSTLAELKEADAHANRMNNNRLTAENAALRARVARLERQIPAYYGC